MVEASDAAHTITIITLRVADLYGQPHVAARCTCGWQGDPRGGRHARPYAKEDSEAHLRGVKE